MHNKNLLIVTTVFPYPLNSGGAQAQFHLINSLRTRINISLAYISKRPNDDEALKQLWPDVKFHAHNKQRLSWFPRKYRKFITKLYKKIDSSKSLISPHLTHSYENSIDYAFIDFLQQVIKKDTIDIIQFEFSNSLNIAYAFPNIKRIFIQHEILFIRNLRFIKEISSLAAHDYYQYNMLKNQEISAMNACDAVVTLTEVDKRILQKERVTSSIFVSPAIIPLNEKELSTNYRFNNQLIFIGGEEHYPNYEGVIWFLKSVWEKILEEKPGTSLHIIGKWSNRTRRAITKQYRNVHLTGFIPSLKPYLGGSVMIVPILTGSGMRMKIIEAANNGIPFITTEVGVEGLDFTNKKDCFIENDPVAFAKKTIKLMNSQSLQLSFRTNSFIKIQSLFPIEEMIKQRLDVYKQV